MERIFGRKIKLINHEEIIFFLNYIYKFKKVYYNAIDSDNYYQLRRP